VHTPVLGLGLGCMKGVAHCSLAWRTWRRPPTSSLLLDWSCKRTRRRKSTL